MALERLNRLDEAADAFHKATWSAETAGAAYYHLACISVRKGELNQALAFADESLIRGWHDMRCRALKAGILYHLDGDLRPFLRESLAIDPLYFGLLYRSSKPEAFARSAARVENWLNTALELLDFGFDADAASLLTRCPFAHPMLRYAHAFAEARLRHTGEALRQARLGEQLPTDGCFPNRIAERFILDKAIALLEEAGEKAPMAHYYAGELLYDKRQYTEAFAHWRTAVQQKPVLAPAWRCLSIADYNHGDRELAAAEIAEACRLEPGNSRFLLEQDQLLKRLGKPVQERLALLEAHRELLGDRYALMLAYVSLLNAAHQHEKALEILETYTFHVWEGGEGKVADEYKAALFALAEQALADGTPESLREAIALADRTRTYPSNLGEGKLDNVPDNRADYLCGCAWRALGEEEKARACFIRATAGPRTPEPVRYYNDQPSDYIYDQGMAFHALGDDEQAKKSFHQLITFGERHLFDRVSYDFFAVSMPELEVYQDDIQQRSDDYCRRLIALGRKGLSEIGSR